jgi:hypothetical protein
VVFVSSATGCFFANIKLYRVECFENCFASGVVKSKRAAVALFSDPPTAVAKAAKHRTEGFLQASRSVGR